MSQFMKALAEIPEDHEFRQELLERPALLFLPFDVLRDLITTERRLETGEKVASALFDSLFSSEVEQETDFAKFRELLKRHPIDHPFTLACVIGKFNLRAKESPEHLEKFKRRSEAGKRAAEIRLQVQGQRNGPRDAKMRSEAIALRDKDKSEKYIEAHLSEKYGLKPRRVREIIKY